MLRRSTSDQQSEYLEQQQRQRFHTTALQQSMNGQSVKGQSVQKQRRQHLEGLTKNELDDNTNELMTNLFSQDFLLSNLKDAEVKEIKWLARSIARKIKGMHPHAESAAQGEYRKLVFDDPKDGLKALSSYQETLIDQAVLDFLTRPPRSRDGWQQDEIGKQVNVSKVEDQNQNAEKGSLFRR